LSIDLRDRDQPAQAICEGLGLSPHPEGGHYRETWRDAPPGGGRGSSTCILFLLMAGERSRWHRVDATEIWLWQAGAPLLLNIADPGGLPRSLRLGPCLAHRESLQGVVAAQAWQEAASLGAWSLVSCVVAPAFTFSGFEMAPDGWSPESA
jgi:predicted cupin superfamily sugar epimerase